MDGGAVLELLVIACALLVLVSAVAWHAVDTLWTRRLMTRRTVLVQLRSGHAVKGLLWKRSGRTVVVKGAELFEPGADPVKLSGPVVLDRDAVEWIQVDG